MLRANAHIVEEADIGIDLVPVDPLYVGSRPRFYVARAGTRIGDEGTYYWEESIVHDWYNPSDDSPDLALY